LQFETPAIQTKKTGAHTSGIARHARQYLTHSAYWATFHVSVRPDQRPLAHCLIYYNGRHSETHFQYFVITN